ncbi:VCBS repeat-containing protein [Streptomyces sp. L06]|nr:VCBS repeat-containing protein [Streptomyces sp. L06]
MRTRPLATALVLALTAGGGLLALAPAATAAPARAVPAVPYDVDGDGYAESVVGVPGGGKGGYLTVVPGSAKGPVTGKHQVISQASPGIGGTDEAGDAFGTAPVSADLNNDGYADVVVGSPGEDRANDFAPGRLVILWGSAKGLNRTTSVTSAHEEAGGLGTRVADVNGDGHLDLVTTQNGDEKDSLAVALGPFRPGMAAPKLKLAGGAPHFTRLTTFTTGDFDGDGRDDVVFHHTAYEESSGPTWYRGTATGLSEEGATWRNETTGTAFAAADLDRDGRDDLIIGDAHDAPDPWGERDPSHPVDRNSGGVVRVLFGSPAGPGGDRAPLDLSQETPGVPGSGQGASEAGDHFGASLAVGDLDGDGHQDLAVGAPGEGINAATDAGAVTLLPGSPTGPAGQGATTVNQGTPGIPGANETGDAFGTRLLLADLDGDHRDDLLSAAPAENAGRGAVWAVTSTALSFSPASLTLPPKATGFGGHLGY